jgi:hypothetical protein
MSNYFDALLRGLGRRGSSFTDVDALTHDDDTDRFLFQEFKSEQEPQLNVGQLKTLKALARRRDFITVWCVRRQPFQRLKWYDVGSQRIGIITIAEYQRLFRAWWDNVAIEPFCEHPAIEVPPPPVGEPALFTADEIPW